MFDETTPPAALLVTPKIAVLDPATPEWRTVTLGFPIEQAFDANGRPHSYIVHGTLSYQHDGASTYTAWSSPGFQGEIARLVRTVFHDFFNLESIFRDFPVNHFAYSAGRLTSPASFSARLPDDIGEKAYTLSAHQKLEFMELWQSVAAEQKRKKARFGPKKS